MSYPANCATMLKTILPLLKCVAIIKPEIKVPVLPVAVQ